MMMSCLFFQYPVLSKKLGLIPSVHLTDISGIFLRLLQGRISSNRISSITQTKWMPQSPTEPSPSKVHTQIVLDEQVKVSAGHECENDGNWPKSDFLSNRKLQNRLSGHFQIHVLHQNDSTPSIQLVFVQSELLYLRIRAWHLNVQAMHIHPLPSVATIG